MELDNLKNDIIPKYLELGDTKFNRLMLLYALNKLVLIEKNEYKGMYPDLEFLDFYDKLIILYRREGDENFFKIAKIFRQLAHKIYRIMLKKNMTNTNFKFLNLVKCQ